MKNALVVVSLALVAATIQGAVIHVPGDSTTIQTGINGAGPGDTVLVAAGTYTENLAFSGVDIKVISADGAEATIVEPASTASPTVTITLGESSLTEFAGFTVRNSSTSTAIQIEGSNPVIHHNILTSNVLDGGWGGPSVLYADASAAPVVHHNLCYNNNGFASIRCDGSAHIYNNTVFNAMRYGIYAPAAGAVVTNNIAMYCRSQNGIGPNSPPGFVDYNNTLFNGVMLPEEPNGFHVDPIFVDSAAGDFHLAISSPLLNVGNPDPFYNESDGTRSDVGAFPIVHEPPVAVNLSIEEGTFTPQFSWGYADTAATSQQGYEIEVGTDRDWSAAEMWSSGTIMSGATSVVYAGSALSDRHKYYVRVRLYNGTVWGSFVEAFFTIAVAANQVITVPGGQPTIQAAVDVAVTGDTVRVADGTYTGDGNRDIRFYDQAVVLESENGPYFTVLDCQTSESDKHYAFFFPDSTSGGRSVIDGFGITNAEMASSSYYGGAAILVRGTVPAIRNCRFYDNPSNGIFFDYGADTAHITNSVFSSCGSSALSCGWSGPSLLVDSCEFLFNGDWGIYYHGTRPVRITNSVFRGNARDGAYVNHSWSDPGMVATGCTFVGNQYGLTTDWDPPKDGRSVTAPANDTSVIGYNLFYGNTYSGLRVWAPWSVTVTCNNLFGNGNDDLGYVYGDTINNIFYDPLFCDTLGGEYYIDSLSPCSPYSPLNPCGERMGYYGLACRSYPDADADSIPDALDNCPDDYNPGQSDLDDDGIGDACDDYYVRTWYVKPDGTGDVATIQEALDSAGVEDTVLLAPGTFTGDGNRELDFQGKSVYLTSENGPAQTSIDLAGPYAAFLMNDGEDTTSIIEGISMTGSTLTGSDTAVIVCDASSVTMINCVLFNHDCGGIKATDAHVILRSCSISLCGGRGIQLWNGRADIDSCLIGINSGHGVSVEGSGQLVISYSTLYANDSTGVWMYTDFAYYSVTNCTFVANGRGLLWDATYPKAGYSRLQDSSIISYNLFAFNEGNGLEAGLDDLSVGIVPSCNDSYGNGGEDFAPDIIYYGAGDENNNFSLDPLICDTTYLTFELDAVSPCLPGHVLNPCNALIGAFGEGCALAPDSDDDGVTNSQDNCPFTYNPDQADSDDDGIGDACDLPPGQSLNVKADGTGEYATIQAALDAAEDGDTVLCEAGTYTGDGNRDLVFYGKKVALVSASGASATTIDCEATQADQHIAFYFLSEEDSLTKVDGFTVTGALLEIPYAGVAAAAVCSTGAPLFRNCIFTENDAPAIWYKHTWTARQIWLQDCSFLNNDAAWAVHSEDVPMNVTGCRFEGNSQAGLDILWGDSAVVRNCIFANNGFTGLRIWRNLYPPENIDVSHNTFVGNGGDGFSFSSEAPKSRDAVESSATVLNSQISYNIAAYNAHSGFGLGTASDADVMCNVAYGNGFADYFIEPGWTGDTANNFTAQPLFCDTVTGDYRVAEGSLCAPANNACGVLIGSGEVGCACCVMRGDADHNGKVNVADLTFLVGYLFKGGPQPTCVDEGNVDANSSDSAITISDVTYLVEYLFKAGPPPPAC